MGERAQTCTTTGLKSARKPLEIYYATGQQTLLKFYQQYRQHVC